MKLGLRLSQSRPLYQAFKQLKERHWDELTPAQRRAVDAEIRDFVLGGVALEVRRFATRLLPHCLVASADPGCVAVVIMQCCSEPSCWPSVI